MSENWRPVVGYEDYYEVSDQGRVRTLRSGQIKRTHLSPGGYPQLGLSRQGKQRSRLVHQLVLEAFAGPRPDGAVACHNNGDPTDNRSSNLRWDSASSNMLDVAQHGRHKNALKTHCPKGHPYAGDNVRVYVQRGGHLRRCVTCERERSAARSEALRRRTAEKRGEKYGGES
jgi:hypothetical protein